MVSSQYYRTVILFIAGIAIVLSACGNGAARWKPGKPFARENIKVGIIHPNEISADSGYDYMHFLGTREMQEQIGLRDDQIIRKVNVFEESPQETETAIRDCISAGVNIIIAASWGYMDICEKLSREFPHVVFAHSMGYKYNKTNFTNFSGRVYQTRYLSGIAAGLKTQTGKIGYVAAMGKTHSEVSAGLNAFALGVEKVNPEARIYVRVTHSWFDPMGETDAANELIGLGCDVIAQHSNTAYPQITAQRAGVWGIGFNSDMEKEAPDAVLTSVVINWGVYYTHLVQTVIDGSFTTDPYFGGIREGMVDITPLNERLVTPGTAEKIAEERQRLISGAFNVFDGVLRTSDGGSIGSAGATLPDSEIIGGINWYYHTIIED